MSSPVVAGDLVFGHSDHNMGHLFCLDARTGETLWQSHGRMGSYASIVNAGSVWLVLTNRGQLLVIKPGGATYEVIAQYQVAEKGDTWAHPVFLGNRILIKDTTTLRSLRIQEDPNKP
jgi:outer membrane protein assembly factor BamB